MANSCVSYWDSISYILQKRYDLPTACDFHCVFRRDCGRTDPPHFHSKEAVEIRYFDVR